MRRRLTSWAAGLGLLVACASHVFAQTAPPAQVPTPPALSELQQCSVERHALQAQVVELRAKLVELQTQIDRQALAAERTRIEGTLPIPAGWRWDWATLRMVPVKDQAPNDVP